MTLLDAPQYDGSKDKRNKILIITGVVVVVVATVVLLYWPYFMARRTVNHFMEALVAKNFPKAYVIWQADPKHYPMDTFMQDWGPAGRWGIIKTYRIVELGKPPGSGPSSGLVALVEINGITGGPDAEARIWIENKSHLLSFYQF